MDRLTFVKYFVGTALIGIPLFGTVACASSEDDDMNNSSKNCLANGTNSSIASNHGHSLQVSKSDINAGVEKQYNIKGSSSHTHTVTVSASNFTTLKSNQQIKVNSTSDDSHSHSVTISCA